jgi:1,4-alpha-glucan branching enzyme
MVTEVDQYLFGQGTHYEIYNKLGAHITRQNGKDGVNFAVWAPNAKAVSVVGDFNGWDVQAAPMRKLGDGGIWEVWIPGKLEGNLYKYWIDGADGKEHYKADPFAFEAELRPGTASKVADISNYSWKDSKWLNAQIDARAQVGKPVSIYEVHLGSWKKDYSLNEDGFYDYKRAAAELADYVTSMGYTHVELMGIAEHPFDGSWGYQVTGYYAPTARYGAAKDFKYFVDYMHQKGIGVILDWVPAHFPKDAFGLAMFDGSPVYEYADPRKGEHPDWGTKVFDYSKNEVTNFLIANALFWVKEYHIDGLRVDAVASMLYLDYGRNDGEWIPNIYGENKNLEAIEFFKHLSSVLERQAPKTLLIAEESTAWPDVTRRPEDNGLGFTMKWNMGWMHDFLDYMKLDPYFRKDNHNKMTFAMSYNESEKYILVLSHDEVVHLKCSMLNKMPGYPSDKFKNLKTAYTFMMGHPGKKLLFMGQEFAQLHEWAEDMSLEWHLLQEQEHRDVQEHMKKLLHLYRSYPALYADDRGYDSFEWINCNDADRSTFSFIRKAPDSDKGSLLFICNFTPMEWGDYAVGVPHGGKYKTLLSSTEPDNHVTYTAVAGECDGKPYRLQFALKPFESLVIEIPATSTKPRKSIGKKQSTTTKKPHKS